MVRTLHSYEYLRSNKFLKLLTTVFCSSSSLPSHIIQVFHPFFLHKSLFLLMSELSCELYLSSLLKPQFQLLFCTEAYFWLRKSLRCPLQSRACSSKSHQAAPFHDQNHPQCDISCVEILDIHIFFWLFIFGPILPFIITTKVAVSSNTEKIMIQCLTSVADWNTIIVILEVNVLVFKVSCTKCVSHCLGLYPG